MSATKGVSKEVLWADTIKLLGKMLVILLIVFPISHFLVGLLRYLICPSYPPILLVSVAASLWPSALRVQVLLL